MHNPYESPKEPSEPPRAPGEGDATGGVIPYKNGPALLAYYLGIASLFCCIIPLPGGIVPLVLGIMGLRKRAREPEVKGSVHAWIGIVLGALTLLWSLGILLLLLLGPVLDKAAR